MEDKQAIELLREVCRVTIAHSDAPQLDLDFLMYRLEQAIALIRAERKQAALLMDGVSVPA